MYRSLVTDLRSIEGAQRDDPVHWSGDSTRISRAIHDPLRSKVLNDGSGQFSLKMDIAIMELLVLLEIKKI